MAKREANPSIKVATAGTETPDAVEQRVVEFAEQLGRMVGTVQAKAEGWLDRKALNAQLTHIRDGATALLAHIAHAGNGTAKPKDRVATAADADTGRSGGVVDAPGKRHRKPPASRPGVTSRPGVKKSDDRIAKMKMANETRHRSRG